jgi:hypothetical protein
LLKRLKETETYKRNAKEDESQKVIYAGDLIAGARSQKEIKKVTSPRRKKRERAMRTAKDISSARSRQVVVGRPSWPMDQTDGPNRENH